MEIKDKSWVLVWDEGYTTILALWDAVNEATWQPGGAYSRNYYTWENVIPYTGKVPDHMQGYLDKVNKMHKTYLGLTEDGVQVFEGDIGWYWLKEDGVVNGQLEIHADCMCETEFSSNYFSTKEACEKWAKENGYLKEEVEKKKKKKMKTPEADAIPKGWLCMFWDDTVCSTVGYCGAKASHGYDSALMDGRSGTFWKNASPIPYKRWPQEFKDAYAKFDWKEEVE